MERIPDQIRWHLVDLQYELGCGELIPRTSGYQRCPPGHRDEMFPHYWILCYVQNGTCTVCPDSRGKRKSDIPYTVGPGECFLMPPSELVSYEAGVEEPWINAWFGFSGDGAERFLTMTDFSRHSVLRMEDNLYDTIRILTDTALSVEDSDTRRVYASAVLWQIFSTMIEKSVFRQEQRHRNPYTEQALSLIRKNYSKEYSVSDIAGKLNISREYLYTLFKRDMGCSPSRYLLEYRLQRACMLLETSGYPVYLIAQYTGFSSETYFSRKFRELFGISPGIYRKMKQSGQ